MTTWTPSRVCPPPNKVENISSYVHSTELPVVSIADPNSRIFKCQGCSFVTFAWMDSDLSIPPSTISSRSNTHIHHEVHRRCFHPSCCLCCRLRSCHHRGRLVVLLPKRGFSRQKSCRRFWSFVEDRFPTDGPSRTLYFPEHFGLPECCLRLFSCSHKYVVV